MSDFHRFYVGWCVLVGVVFMAASWSGYRVPNLGIIDEMSGRSSGGSWGGGK